MDKQINTSRIPINTRTVGTPSGIYILYMEDYVHTFIKKFQSGETEIAFFGRRYEEEGRSILVVSGAAEEPFSEDKGKQYFPNCAFLGVAKAGVNKEEGLRLELSLKNTNVVLDDFYIYYDQNEEMQTYLIEWNMNHQTPESRGEKAEQRDAQNRNHLRAEMDDAVRYGRIAQAYNREEAKVSFIWNVMNVLCLGFVVCVMAYGIISINNYHKMQDMQKTIDYCMALVTENISIQPRDAVLTNGTAVTVTGEAENAAGQHTNEAVAEKNTIAEAAGEETFNAETPNAETPNAQISNAETSNAQTSNAETSNVQTSNAETSNVQTSNAETFNAETSNAQISNAQTSNAAVSNDETSGIASSGAETSGTGTPAEQIAANTQQEGSGATPAAGTGEQDAAAGIAQSNDAEAAPQYYVVRRGDTLRSICYEVYGDYSKVDEVCKWNKIEDPDNILYGQRLLLP